MYTNDHRYRRRRRASLLTVCILGATALAGCCELAARPVELGAPGPVPPERIDAQDRCAAEKLALSGRETDLVALGVPPADAAAWLTVRRGSDGVEGSADDGHLDGGAARASLGAATMDRLAAWARGQRATPGVACGALEVRLLAINDFHGQLEPPGGSGGRVTTPAGDVPAGGAAFLATWLTTLAENHPRTLVVSAGDNIGATPLISAAFHDEPTIEALDLMRLGVSTVGNHEFDEGLAELLRMQRGGCHPSEGCFGGDGFGGAQFEYLAANVVEDANGKTVFPATTVRRFGKARIGFIGMTLSGTKAIVSSTATAGLSFLDEVPTAARYAAELRANGVESIVLLLHEGGFATGSHNGCEGFRGPLADLVPRLDPAIDVVIAGHTNAMHVCAIGGTLVTSAGHYGRLVTAIDLGIDETGGDVVAKRAENVIVTRDVAPEPAMAALIARYRDLTAPVVNRIVGTIAGDLVKTPSASGEIPLGGVIADAQVAASAADAATGADRAVVAFMNPGGIRAELLARPAASDRPAGAITFGELFAVQPFGNDLVVMTLTGAQIERLLEEQFVSGGKARDTPRILQVSEGCTFTWKAGPGVADRTGRIDPAHVRIAGKALDLGASYRVVVNGFLATGGDGFAVFKEGTARRVAGVEVDALADYLATHPGLKAPVGARITTR